MLCRAYRNKGVPCTYNAKKDSDLCKLHFNSKEMCPIDWETKQIEIKIKSLANKRYSLSIAPPTAADIKYREQEKIKVDRKNQRHRERIHMRFYGYRDYEYENDGDDVIAGAGAEAPALVAQAFHEDNQNVHRVETVTFVKNAVSKIAAIKIDDPDFLWNSMRVSKTPGEIIIECSLTPAAAVLLIQKYAASDTIYDMVPGIYGKVLDGVLQFIKKSEDSVNLYKTLKIELEDNVEMCAQGNLSRLCNVLGGYLDGISTASVAEILGDLLPPLASIASLDARYTAAVEILRTHNVHEDTWNDWLEPLEVDRFPPFTLLTDGRL